MQSFKNIQAVTFDVGGTLIDPWPSPGQVYAEVAGRHGWKELDPVALDRQFAQAWKSKRNFDYSRPAWVELVAKTFSEWIEPGGPMPFFDELYERFAEPDVWRIHEDVLPAIETLIERGFELGVISNWDERLRPLLKRLRLDRYFRVVIISQEIGFHKPSPVIFHEAVRKFTCPAASVLHIGDGDAEDFEGARQAGLLSLLLDRKDAATRLERVRSLNELARWIE